MVVDINEHTSQKGLPKPNPRTRDELVLQVKELTDKVARLKKTLKLNSSQIKKLSKLSFQNFGKQEHASKGCQIGLK